MKSRKTSFDERLEIIKWVIENNINYKNVAEKYAITYALVYKWINTYMNNNHLVFSIFDKAMQKYPNASPYFTVIEGFNIQEMSLKVSLKKLE